MKISPPKKPSVHHFIAVASCTYLVFPPSSFFETLDIPTTPMPNAAKVLYVKKTSIIIRLLTQWKPWAAGG